MIQPVRWVIGDIHGMADMLEALVGAIDRTDPAPRFCFLGDFVNRGPDSRRVIDLVLSLKHARCCRGNHDDVLDLILHELWMGGERGSYEPESALNWFLDHGLEATLLSYGVSKRLMDAHRADDDEVQLIDAIRHLVPPEHKQFIRKLRLYIDDPDALIAHAFWPVSEHNDPRHVHDRLAGDVVMRHRVIWERYQAPALQAPKPWSRPGFFGHTPVNNYPGSLRSEGMLPVRGPQIMLLDTAAAVSAHGRLSAWCIEEHRLVQVDRSGHIL